MTPRYAQPQPTRQLEMALAFVFGGVALAAVLWLAFRAETLNEQQFEILRIVLALAGGGVGAVIPGFLDISMKAGAKLALRAGGALADGRAFPLPSRGRVHVPTLRHTQFSPIALQSTIGFAPAHCNRPLSDSATN